MNLEALKETIRQELPELLRRDPDFRSYILEITRGEFADRKETQDWFHETLAEMRREREKQDKKWDQQIEEQAQKWKLWQERWDKQIEEQERHRKEQAQKWDKHVEEQAQKWDKQIEEQERHRDEQAQKWILWQERWEVHDRRHQEEFNRVHEEIMALAKKHDRSIGALGARWGMQSERSFRNALAGILEKHFGVKVTNVNEYDEQGVVFGRPDQIELDVIIKNSLLLICELKSSIDKAGMHIFERKARFYESRHNCKADRLIVISPMIDPQAQILAEQLNIETYSDSLEVESLDSRSETLRE
jgi:hypothetical protein